MWYTILFSLGALIWVPTSESSTPYHENQSVIVNDTIHLSCYPDNYKSNFVWKFSNESGQNIPLTDDESYNFEKRFVLILKSVEKRHQGRYTAYDKRSEVCTIHLKVQDVQTVTMHSEVGQNVEINFPNPNGDLQNRYHWIIVSKINTTIIKDSLRYKNGYSRLEITNVTLNDNATFMVRSNVTNHVLHIVNLVVDPKTVILKPKIGLELKFTIKYADGEGLYEFVKISKNNVKTVIKEGKLISGEDVLLYKMKIDKDSYGNYLILKNGSVIHKLKLIRQH